jgi:hypothetical protein
MTHDGDWMGFYVNGRLIEEGHSLQISTCLAELVGYEIIAYGDVYDEKNKLGNLDKFGGRCPRFLDDLMKELR